MKEHILHLTHNQLSALFSLVNERYMHSVRTDFDGVDEWVDVLSGDIVTVQDLVVLLSRYMVQ